MTDKHDALCEGDAIWQSKTKPCPVCALIAAARADERKTTATKLHEYVDSLSNWGTEDAKDAFANLPDDLDVGQYLYFQRGLRWAALRMEADL
jgi:hypothetical protein